MEKERGDFKEQFKTRLYGWVLRLLKFIDQLPRDSVCGVMGKQLIRSGTSILANYIEARAASSKKDFINFFTHALKSGNESKIWLKLLGDLNKGNREELEWLSKELTEITNVVASSILTLKGRR